MSVVSQVRAKRARSFLRDDHQPHRIRLSQIQGRVRFRSRGNPPRHSRAQAGTLSITSMSVFNEEGETRETAATCLKRDFIKALTNLPEGS